MKILSLGLDNSILDKNSALAKRTVEYGALVDKYSVIVPSGADDEVALSEKAKAFGVKSANKIIVLLKIYLQAKKLIKREKINVITVQDQYYLALIGLLLARKFKIGLEAQVHGFEKFFGLRKIIAKYVLPRADAIRVVSGRLKRQLVEEFGVKEEKITVVPIYSGIRNKELGIKDNPAESVATRLCRNTEDRFVFLTVGRLVPVKNIGMQIRAIKNLELRIKNYVSENNPQAENRMSIELWIIGDGPDRKKLEKLCCELRVASCVKFLGWQNDLRKYYEQADAFLLTSNSEGWGLAVIEAASFGLPIIMTDVGCAGEVIVDGESGIIIPVGDQSKLEESMVKLINDLDLRKRLGKNAWQAVNNLFNLENTLKLYKSSWINAIKNAKQNL